MTDTPFPMPGESAANQTTTAAVFHGTGRPITVEQLPLPALRPGEILVSVEACTICGSDLHSFHGRRTVPVPSVLGHEIIGRVAAFGDGAPRHDLRGYPLTKGSRIVWSLVVSCGDCIFCCGGLPQKCERLFKYGHEPLDAEHPITGGLAEHCVLVAGTSIVAVPDELPAAVAAPASCATATIMAALECVDVRDRCVCVSGLGMLGLTAAAVCHQRGARFVVGVDLHACRRKRALQFGADAACHPEQLPEILAPATGGRGADVALELSGAPAAFHMLWPAIRTGGTLVLAGAVFPADAVAVAMHDIVRRHLTIRGVHNYRPEYLVEALTFLHEMHEILPLAELVSAWYPLHEAAAAMAAAGDPTNLRVGVRCCPLP